MLLAWSPLMVSGPGPVLFAVLFTASSCAILAAVRAPWYPRWRGTVINCRQMLTIVSFYALIIRTEPFAAYLAPPPPPATWYRTTRSLVMLPLMLLAVGSSYPTPVRSKAAVLTAGLAACVPTGIAVCRAAATPGSARYRAMVAAAEALARRVVPLQVIDIVTPAGRALFDAPALSEFGACVAVRAALHIAFGFLLPLSVLAAEEVVSRAAFDRSHLGGTGAAYSLRTTTLLHLGMGVVESAAAFHIVVRVLHLIGLAGLAPTLTNALF